MSIADLLGFNLNQPLHKSAAGHDARHMLEEGRNQAQRAASNMASRGATAPGTAALAASQATADLGSRLGGQALAAQQRERQMSIERGRQTLGSLLSAGGSAAAMAIPGAGPAVAPLVGAAGGALADGIMGAAAPQPQVSQTSPQDVTGQRAQAAPDPSLLGGQSPMPAMPFAQMGANPMGMLPSSADLRNHQDIISGPQSATQQTGPMSDHPALSGLGSALQGIVPFPWDALQPSTPQPAAPDPSLLNQPAAAPAPPAPSVGPSGATVDQLRSVWQANDRVGSALAGGLDPIQPPNLYQPPARTAPGPAAPPVPQAPMPGMPQQPAPPAAGLGQLRPTQVSPQEQQLDELERRLRALGGR